MDFLLHKRFLHTHSFLKSLPRLPGNHLAQELLTWRNLGIRGESDFMAVRECNYQ